MKQIRKTVDLNETFQVELILTDDGLSIDVYNKKTGDLVLQPWFNNEDLESIEDTECIEIEEAETK